MEAERSAQRKGPDRVVEAALTRSVIPIDNWSKEGLKCHKLPVWITVMSVIVTVTKI